MSDLLTEVDEVMRQERLAKFWHENGTLIIIFVAATIILTGVFSAYRTWDHNVKTEQTNALIAFTNALDYPQNIFDPAFEFDGNFRAIAVLGAAGTFIAQDNPEDAKILYGWLVEDTDIDVHFRHLAIVMHTRLALNSDDPENDLDTKLLLETLAPVLSPKSPYYAQAQIEAAVIQANLAMDYTAAMTHLNAVLDSKNLPTSLYARAQNLHHVYSLKEQLRDKQTSSISQ